MYELIQNKEISILSKNLLLPEPNDNEIKSLLYGLFILFIIYIVNKIYDGTIHS